MRVGKLRKPWGGVGRGDASRRSFASTECGRVMHYVCDAPCNALSFDHAAAPPAGATKDTPCSAGVLALG